MSLGKLRANQVATAMPEEFDAYRKWLGIPPEDQPPHHYRLLGIAPFEDDPDVIQNAADRQMAHVRTYQAGKHAKLAQQILNELSSARVCLLNAAKKTEYDTAFRARLAGVTDVEIVDVDSAPPAPPPAFGGVQVAAEPATVAAGKFDFKPAALPQPIVVPAAKGGRAGSAARFSKGKRRSNTFPIFLVLACVLALGGAVAIVMNFDKLKTLGAGQGSGAGKAHGTEAKGNKHDKEGTDKPANNPDRPERPNPTRPSGRPGGKPDDDLLFKPSPTIPPRPPVQDLSKGARQENLRKALSDARRALEVRQTSAARQYLIAADSFKANQAEADEIEHLRMLADYLDGFWRAVYQGVHKLKPGERLKFAREEIRFKEMEGETVFFHLGDLEQKLKIHDLDAKAAVVFASRSMKGDDPFAPIYAATFLALDNQGGRQQPEWQANLATELWHAAARRGEKNAYLAKELGIDKDAEPKPGGEFDAALERAGKDRTEDKKRD